MSTHLTPSELADFLHGFADTISKNYEDQEAVGFVFAVSAGPAPEDETSPVAVLSSVCFGGPGILVAQALGSLDADEELAGARMVGSILEALTTRTRTND